MKAKLWFIALLFILPLVISSSYMVLAQPYKIRKLGEQYKYRKHHLNIILQHYVYGLLITLLYIFLIFFGTHYIFFI